MNPFEFALAIIALALPLKLVKTVVLQKNTASAATTPPTRTARSGCSRWRNACACSSASSPTSATT